jgi:hypothetical protein
MQMLTSGNSLYVDEMGIGSASRVTPVQLAEEEDENDSRKLLAIIGITGAVIAAAGFLVSGGKGGDEKPVSPKAP